MRVGPKIGVGLFLLIAAGAGVGVRGYFRMLDEAKGRQLIAASALMNSEALVWTLEGECLKDASRVLSEPNARKIAASAEGAEGGSARIETHLREYVRVRRDAEVWKAAEKAFVTMTPDSRKATDEAAVKAGLRPVDILSEWMTCDGATDLYLMTKVYNERTALRASVGAIVDTFFAEGAKAPSAELGVKVASVENDRIVVDLFGGKVIEEWIPGKAQLLGEGKVKLTWKSNYNYLRDVVRGKKPELTQDDTLVKSDDGYGVEYQGEIDEFLKGADKLPWATVLCTKGVLALGELLASRSDEKDEKKPEKDEKKPEKK